MQVISLINGSLISENSTIYALHYAKFLSYKLTLIHINNGKDDIKEVKKSAEELMNLAKKFEVESEFLMFEKLKELKNFVEIKDVDMMFCSTRNKHNILDKSFVQKIIKKEMMTDLAVVKIVKLGRSDNVENIILPIRDSKMSVRKFTLFSSFVLAYSTKSEIYSIDKVSPMEFKTKNQKERLKEVKFNLRHYFRLAKMMNFKFSLKHDFAMVEEDKVKTHIAKNSYDLAIVGAHHDKSFFRKHPIDTLFEKPLINTIYFIPHKDEV
jgi:hypothetical protein